MYDNQTFELFADTYDLITLSRQKIMNRYLLHFVNASKCDLNQAAFTSLSNYISSFKKNLIPLLDSTLKNDQTLGGPLGIPMYNVAVAAKTNFTDTMRLECVKKTNMTDFKSCAMKAVRKKDNSEGFFFSFIL